MIAEDQVRVQPEDDLLQGYRCLSMGWQCCSMAHVRQLEGSCSDTCDSSYLVEGWNVCLHPKLCQDAFDSFGDVNAC